MRNSRGDKTQCTQNTACLHYSWHALYVLNKNSSAVIFSEPLMRRNQLHYLKKNVQHWYCSAISRSALKPLEPGASLPATGCLLSLTCVKRYTVDVCLVSQYQDSVHLCDYRWALLTGLEKHCSDNEEILLDKNTRGKICSPKMSSNCLRKENIENICMWLYI